MAKNEHQKTPSLNLEDKRKRFNTVASRRVQRVLDSMDNLAKCANRRNYDYTDDETKKMLRVINDKFTLLKAAFSSSSKTGKQTFEF
jgi:light-regulated signal transduction histidine kinase (bacteriophytochrome)